MDIKINELNLNSLDSHHLYLLMSRGITTSESCLSKRIKALVPSW